MQVKYCIDSEDKIYQINPYWDEFAIKNDALHLFRDTIIGQNIFDYISGESMCDLWSNLFKRCRNNGTALKFNYRCDSPQAKRFMSMELIPLSNKHVGLISTVTSQEKYDLKVIDRNLRRNDNIIVMCSWCKKIRIAEDTWMEIDEAINHLNLFFIENMPRISHGVCKTCEASVMREYYQHRLNSKSS